MRSRVRVDPGNGAQEARTGFSGGTTGLLKAEDQFRRVKGYKAMPQLIAALENVSLSEGKDVA